MTIKRIGLDILAAVLIIVAIIAGIGLGICGSVLLTEHSIGWLISTLVFASILLVSLVSLRALRNTNGTTSARSAKVAVKLILIALCVGVIAVPVFAVIIFLAMRR